MIYCHIKMSYTFSYRLRFSNMYKRYEYTYFWNIIRKMMTRFEWKRKRIKEGKSRHQRNYPKSIPKLYVYMCAAWRDSHWPTIHTHFSPSTYTKAHILQICMTIKGRRWCGTNNEKLKWKFHSHSVSTAFLEKYTETYMLAHF